VSFSINTNITSLQAQNNLNTSATFQSKTINQVTSGLRIVTAGDDAAGLAIANGLRSSQATLTQGIQNANNGLSTLQTIDGGINNISTLLDRASTLAAQSASGTFTGDRNVLNSEFQSVVTEINRQAQSIGLDTGGNFTKALSIFIGGGQANKGATAVSNGSINIDLSKAAVDSQSLGLNGTRASGAAGTDIGNGGATTVANILANTSNAAAATTSFVLSGAGFSDSGKQTLNVNLAGVTNTDTLVSAINNAIKLATTTSTGASTATPFANAGITASLTTDSTGKQQLAFSSSTAAFQVKAGDQVANAFLGNFNPTAANSSTGQALTSTTTGGATTAAGAGAVVLRVQGSGISAPIDFALGAGTITADVTALQDKSTVPGKALADAGITVSQTGTAGPLVFTSATGGSVNVSTTGDTANALGFGSFVSGTTTFDSVNGVATGNGITGTAPAGNALLANNGQRFQISVAGGTSININTGALGATTALLQGAAIATALNTAIQANATLKSAGVQVTADATSGALQFTSTNGTAFRLNATALDGIDGSSVATDLGFGITGVATAASTSNTLVTNSRVDSVGASSTNTFVFNPTADQTISFSANDATGTTHTTAIDLKNQTTTGATKNALSIDQAIDSINKQLQASGDATLQQIVAVKDITVGGSLSSPSDTEGIKFISSLSTFNITLGAAGTVASSQGIGTAADQSTTVISTTGSQADVSTQAGAALAVTTLQSAITKLGVSQAAVGKGENTLNYAVALATSQSTNEAAAESRIRDADLASAAANLSKAQILVQAGTAALAQANSAPQAILALLKG
jgi:flagellin